MIELNHCPRGGGHFFADRQHTHTYACAHTHTHTHTHTHCSRAYKEIPHPPPPPRSLLGDYHYRNVPDAEKHLNDPEAIAKLQAATKGNNREMYKQFSALNTQLSKQVWPRGGGASPVHALVPKTM